MSERKFKGLSHKFCFEWMQEYKRQAEKLVIENRGLQKLVADLVGVLSPNTAEKAHSEHRKALRLHRWLSIADLILLALILWGVW